jgi:hypothetical protein
MRRALAAASVLLAIAAGCGGKREYPPPERYIPADAPLAVVVPAVGAAARQAGALYRTVAQAPQAAPLAEAHAAVKAQLGFDPLDPRGMEQAGFDPAGAAAAATGGGRTTIVALPVVDLPKVDATLARLARDRMGASQRITGKVRGVEVVSFRRETQGPAALAYASMGPHVLFAAGPDAPEAVASAATLPVELSLWKSPAAARARDALGAGWLAMALAPAGSPLLADVRAARDGAALGIRAEATQLGLRLALLLSPEREARWKALRGDGTPAAGAVALLPTDATLRARWAGDPAEAARRLEPWYPADVKKAFVTHKLDPVGGLAPAVGPGGAASLSLAPTFTFAGFSSPRFDVRKTDPFELVQLDAVLPLRDAAALRAFLARLQKAGPRLGVKVVPSGPAAAPTGWTLSWGKAQLGVAIAGERLLVAGGAPRLPALVARASGEAPIFSPPSPAAGAALGSGLGGAALDVERLVKSLEALPEEAYGSGPNAVVMRSLVSRYLEPAAALASVSLRLDLAPGAALVDLDVDGRSAPAKP